MSCHVIKPCPEGEGPEGEGASATSGGGRRLDSAPAGVGRRLQAGCTCGDDSFTTKENDTCQVPAPSQSALGTLQRSARALPSGLPTARHRVPALQATREGCVDACQTARSYFAWTCTYTCSGSRC